MKFAILHGLFLFALTLTTHAVTPQIVILGDSLTAGYGVRPSEAFPALLQKRINDEAISPWEVVNSGVSGNATADGLRRVSSAVTANTRILILALGANDGLRRIPPAQIQENLENIIQAARQRSPSIKILLAGIRVPSEWANPDYARQYEQVFQTIARDQDAILIPHFLDGVGGIAALNQSDGIHPTANGQKLIAQTVWKYLAPLVAEKG